MLVRASFRVRDLDLETLAGARLAGDRAQGIERGRLLLDLQGRDVPPTGHRVDRFVADEPAEARAALVDLGDVRLLEAEALLGLGGAGQVQADEQRVALGLGDAQVLLDLGAAAEATVDLLVAELLLGLVAAAQPDGHHREDEPGDDDHDAEDDDQGPGPLVDDAEDAEESPQDGDGETHADQADRGPRERPPADLWRHLEVDLDLPLEHRLERPDLGVGRPQALDVRAQHGQGDRGGMGPIELRPPRR